MKTKKDSALVGENCDGDCFFLQNTALRKQWIIPQFYRYTKTENENWYAKSRNYLLRTE